MNPAVFGTVTATSACSLGTQGSGAGDYGPDRIGKTLYDAAGRVAEQRTAVGITNAQSPDPGGREAIEAAATYTANGRVATVTDAEGNRTSYEYDGHDRLLNTRYPVAAKGALTSAPTSGSAADYEQLTYESLAGGTRTSPLVAAFRNRAGQSAAFGYDALGRQISRTCRAASPT